MVDSKKIFGGSGSNNLTFMRIRIQGQTNTDPCGSDS
jgi:hypothetical protein